jgi:hypothetical protein
LTGSSVAPVDLTADARLLAWGETALCCSYLSPNNINFKKLIHFVEGNQKKNLNLYILSEFFQTRPRINEPEQRKT